MMGCDAWSTSRGQRDGYRTGGESQQTHGTSPTFAAARPQSRRQAAATRPPRHAAYTTKCLSRKRLSDHARWHPECLWCGRPVGSARFRTFR